LVHDFRLVFMSTEKPQYSDAVLRHT